MKIAIIKLLLCGVLFALILFPGCNSRGFIQKMEYKPGIYEGSGKGLRGTIYVKVQVSEAGIEDIEILSHNESANPGAAAMEELMELVLEYGSTDLDAVSGASFSSRGFLEAVEDALLKAGF